MNKPDGNLLREIAALRKLSVHELRARYLELFGEETRTRNKAFLFRRIAYRLQEKKYGGLTEHARARAEELAVDAPLRRRGTCTAIAPLVDPANGRDPRLPSAGGVLRRKVGNVEHEVAVLEDGFEYAGDRYDNLSAIARKITGTRWNGFLFGLARASA